MTEDVAKSQEVEPQRAKVWTELDGVFLDLDPALKETARLNAWVMTFEHRKDMSTDALTAEFIPQVIGSIRRIEERLVAIEKTQPKQ